MRSSIKNILKQFAKLHFNYMKNINTKVENAANNSQEIE